MIKQNALVQIEPRSATVEDMNDLNKLLSRIDKSGFLGNILDKSFIYIGLQPYSMWLHDPTYFMLGRGRGGIFTLRWN